jgi:phosphoheptose isomerase
VRDGKYRVFVTDGSVDAKKLKNLVPSLVQRTYKGQKVWQVGVFGSAKNATALVQKLAKTGVAATIIL